MATLATRFAGQDKPGLYLVHPQDPAQERECTCDIFIVHGLRGGATSSWQHQESGVIWFQHLLPDYLRDQTNAVSARIWTFGYPADVTFHATTVYELSLSLLNRIKGVRKGYESRKIIWICHSLGGIIVKHALVEAELTARYRSIRTSTVGIVFLSTPHQGSDAASFADTVAGVVNMVTPGIKIFNRDLIRDLKKGSSALFEISSKFSNICAGISIHTFYETGGGHQIVDRTSAVLNLSNEVTRHPLRVTHQEMGKFRDAYDQNWHPVASSILELVLTTTSSARATASGYRSETANTSRAFGRTTPFDPEPPSGPPPPPRQQEFSYGYNQQSSGDGAPQMRPAVSGPPNPAQQWTPRRDPPAAPDATASRPSYPPLNQHQSRLDLRSESRARPAPSSAGSSPSMSTSGGQFLPTPPPQDVGEPTATCDGCGRSIGSAEHRAQCTVCYDYDLCARCFQTGRVSKNHSSSHKMSHVLNTLVLEPDDLVPVREAVNPPTNPAKGRTNWSLVQVPPNTPANPSDHTATLRRLHLFDDDSHARFRAYARPGHYGIAIEIGVHFDPDLDRNPNLRQQLLRRPSGAGKLRVTMGVIANNGQFAGTRFSEDSFSNATVTPTCLPTKLFERGYCGAVVQMGLEVAQFTLQPDSLLHVSGAEDSVSGIGLAVQWSDVPSYQIAKDPVVSITVLRVRMYNVLDYNEPYIRAPAPTQTRVVAPTPNANSGSGSGSGGAQEDDDDDPTVEEFLAALLQIQRAADSAQEKARREALIRQRLAQQEQAKREAVARLYLQAMSEAIQEAAAEEERRQKEAALVQFFQSLGLR